LLVGINEQHSPQCYKNAPNRAQIHDGANTEVGATSPKLVVAVFGNTPQFQSIL